MVLSLFFCWTGPGQAEMATILFPSRGLSDAEITGSSPAVRSLDSFCDPVEISLALALNAFEKDYAPSPVEKIKSKRPIRWSAVRQYRSLPFDAVPYAVINAGTRSEGYYSINGEYRFGEPGQEELARMLLDQDHFVEIVFSIHDDNGKVIEDVAGVYQVNTVTQTLDLSPETAMKRMIDLFRNENALLVHERYCEITAQRAIDTAYTGDFDQIYSITDFVDKRCNAIGQTPLYTSSDLHAYSYLLGSLNEGLETMMFQLRSSEEQPILARQCRSAITRVRECIDTLNDRVNGSY